MKPLFTKGARSRLNTSNKSTGFPNGSYAHQMMPLSGDDGNGPQRSNRYRSDKPAYIVNATAAGAEGSGSEENIIASGIQGGIGYEREFTVEESYNNGTAKAI